ncbi:ASCH domain-containing protein [Vibrio sonorensis]|uniref:ASCH domain-containing protein n=1 Tax=Vibrio sonorensis TaxID=1004316 RepID=UPI0008D96E47|nr:ASCH domain-containing protein [Vibrio sonorensis]
MSPLVQAYLDKYLATLPKQEVSAIPQITAEYYCADEYNANECARLIDAGVKRASCSLKSAYDIEQEPLPVEGRLTVVLNWKEEPICIIKVNQVELCPFNKVTPEFAAKEGEGDLSYQWWYDAHVEFFTQYAAEVGAEFNLESELVLEHFDKVFPVEK